MTFRHVVKEVALEQGVLRDVHAEAVHRPARARACTPTCRCSRATATRSTRPATPYKLSKVGRSFIAGLLRHAAEITAVTNQWVNSYKRLFARRADGAEAPAYVCWGHINRSALVRVPMYKPARATRPGSRSARSTRPCNPYLAFAVLLGAGLKGIEEGYELPAGAEDDVWALTDAERRAMGIEPLPASSPRRST